MAPIGPVPTLFMVNTMASHNIKIIYETDSKNYNCTFPAMIDDWREKWHTFTMEQTDPMFGFGFVQVYKQEDDLM